MPSRKLPGNSRGRRTSYSPGSRSAGSGRKHTSSKQNSGDPRPGKPAGRTRHRVETGKPSFNKKQSYAKQGQRPFKKFTTKRYAQQPGGEANTLTNKNTESTNSSILGAPAKPGFERHNKKPYIKRTGRSDGSDTEKRGFFNKKKFKPDNPEKKRRTQKKAEQQPEPSGKIRLNRFISNSGVCSRREADNLIAMGLISVNGKVITEMGYKVNPGDEVRYENRVLRAEKPVYILMNKPKGYLTTTTDPQDRNTVMHIIGNAVKERVYPVGRLDRNTTGLLLLTNDGDLAEKLSHPSYNVKKIYKAELDKPLTKADFQKILDGVLLEEGRAIVDDLAVVSPDGKTIGLELHIGWNRVVRRIFEALGYQVVKLDRTVYAGLDKKDLPRGEWRFLKPDEIIRLKHFK